MLAAASSLSRRHGRYFFRGIVPRVDHQLHGLKRRLLFRRTVLVRVFAWADDGVGIGRHIELDLSLMGSLCEWPPAETL